jgi:pyruvate-ferredoxin/flavodoxin oxidoreductase
MARRGTVVLVNSHYPAEEVFGHLPEADAASAHRTRLRTVDGRRQRRRPHRRHGQPHQHRAADLLLRDQQGDGARRGHRGRQAVDPQDVRPTRPDVVAKNENAVDAAIAHLHRVEVPAAPVSDKQRLAPVPATHRRSSAT